MESLRVQIPLMCLLLHRKKYEAASILECETIEEGEDESCDYIESYDEQK